MNTGMDVWMDFQAFKAAAVWGKSFIDAKLKVRRRQTFYKSFLY